MPALLVALLVAVLPAFAADPAPVLPPPVNPNAALAPPQGAVTFLHREPAVFPKEAFELHISAGGCYVKTFFDEKGIPYRAVPMLCDGVWVDSSVAAAMKYTIAPYVVDGVPRKVQVDMVLVYTAGDPVPPQQGPGPATTTPPAK